jgi:hypothetical protein
VAFVAVQTVNYDVAQSVRYDVAYTAVYDAKLVVDHVANNDAGLVVVPDVARLSSVLFCYYHCICLM